MRVCHLGKYYAPARGGIETHVRALAHGQAALGADVEIICVNHRDPAGRDVTHASWATTRTIYEQDGPVRLTRVGRRANVKGLDICPRLPLLIRELARRRVDIVHLHLPNPTMLLALASQPLPAALVAAHHSDIIRQRVLRRAILPIKRALFRRASRVLALAARYAEGSDLLQEFAHKVDVLPLGIDLAPYQRPSLRARQVQARLEDEHTGPLWASVGRLVYYKSLDVALHALRQVPGTLVVVGKGPMLEELQALSRRLGVSDRVVWLGEAEPDELVGVLQAARALWFPSSARSEAFGIAQVEALASGCPVINCDIPGSGVPWVALDGHSGLTVPPGDVERFVQAARSLAEDDALHARLSAGARERAQAEFGQDVMAQRSLEIYARCLSG